MNPLKQTYFALGDLSPLRRIERWLNPYRPLAVIRVRERDLAINATHRAEKALAKHTTPLIVEMQLYFSCVVKKRVLFHSEKGTTDGGMVIVNDRLAILFRLVEALSCDPKEFAADYPERRQLTPAASAKIYPSRLLLDYRQGQWRGDFTI
jgi:hypothetical protein